MLQQRPRGTVVPYRVNFTRRQATGVLAAGVGGYLGRGWGWRAVRGVGRYIGALQRNNPIAYQSQVSSMNRLRRKRKFSNQPMAGKKRPKKSLKSRIRSLEKKTSDSISTLTYRSTETAPLTTAVNTASYANYTMNDQQGIEAALSQLRYYSVDTNAIVVNNGATGSYERSFRVNGTMSITVKNNYQVPVVLRAYTYLCNSDTGITPTAWLDACLADNCSTTKASPLVFPSDAKDMGDLWKSGGCKTWTLQPGAVRNMFVKCPEINYDPSEFDNHALTYQPDFKTKSVMFRLSGVVAHDKTTLTNVGLLPGGIDIQVRRTWVLKYNAGGPALNYTYVNDGNDAMLAGGLVSQVVRDNQEYSNI